MKLSFTEDHERLRTSVRAFLEERSPVAEARRLMETDEGHDSSVWADAATRLGLQGLAVPTELGGRGGGLVELAVAFEEMGRTLLPGPYLSTVALAARAVLASGDEAAAKELLPGMASGETVATLAVTEDSGRWEEGAVAARARREGDGWAVDGHKTFVTDGHVADLVLVAARADGAVGLFAVDGRAPGLHRRLLPTMDLTRRQARLELAGTPARLVGEVGTSWAALSRALQEGAVALAAEQAGGASRCLESAVSYARRRHQFGRPIGSFQAVKHKCADMLLLVEHARSAAYAAAWAADEGGDDFAVAASVAKAYCSEAYVEVATEAIHVHGAVGFTWDHDAHLYLRRALSSRALLGDPAHHRELVARAIGL